MIGCVGEPQGIDSQTGTNLPDNRLRRDAAPPGHIPVDSGLLP